MWLRNPEVTKFSVSVQNHAGKPVQSSCENPETPHCRPSPHVRHSCTRLLRAALTGLRGAASSSQAVTVWDSHTAVNLIGSILTVPSSALTMAPWWESSLPEGKVLPQEGAADRGELTF